MEEDSIYALIAKFFHKKREDIHSNTRFRRDLKADSIDFLELVLLTEDRLSCRIDDTELAGVTTVGQYIQLVLAPTENLEEE